MKWSDSVSAMIASVVAVSVAGSAWAQSAPVGRMMAPRAGLAVIQPVAHDENSIAERLFQLERANAALAAKVQAQQAIIDGLKTQPQSATVKDFNDLNVKVWALTSDVATLKTKLYSHTHSYSSQHVAFHNIKCESSDSSPECVHIDAIKDVPSATSPPN